MPLYGGTTGATGTPVGSMGITSSTPGAVSAGFASGGYSTSSKTMPSYTANVQNSAFLGGLLDLLQAAKLADLNTLRVAYENSRALSEGAAQQVNALKAELIALGLIST